MAYPSCDSHHSATIMEHSYSIFEELRIWPILPSIDEKISTPEQYETLQLMMHSKCGVCWEKRPSTKMSCCKKPTLCYNCFAAIKSLALNQSCPFCRCSSAFGKFWKTINGYNTNGLQVVQTQRKKRLREGMLTEAQSLAGVMDTPRGE